MMVIKRSAVLEPLRSPWALLSHAGQIQGEEGPEDPEGDKLDDGEQGQQDVEVVSVTPVRKARRSVPEIRKKVYRIPMLNKEASSRDWRARTCSSVMTHVWAASPGSAGSIQSFIYGLRMARRALSWS